MTERALEARRPGRISGAGSGSVDERRDSVRVPARQEKVLARRPSGALRLALALDIQGDCGTDEIFQCFLIDPVVLVNVDGAPDIPLEAGVEEMGGVLQRSSFCE